MSPRPCPSCADRDTSLYGRYRDEEYFSLPGAFEYRECAACGTVFIDTPPVSQLDRIYPGNYYSFGARTTGITDRVKAWLDSRLLRELLHSIEDERLKVMDVGGGTGWLLDLVRRADSRVKETQIVDLDPGAASIASAKGHQFNCTRIEDFETTSRFHLVLMLNLIEHVEDPRRVLERTARLLEPGGLVLIKTPNMDSLDARLFRNSYWAGLHVPRHWTLFTRGAFERLLVGTGLRVRRFSHTQGAPFWAASLLATLARHGRVRISAERPTPYHPLFGPLTGVFAAFDLARGVFWKTSQMFFVLEKSR